MSRVFPILSVFTFLVFMATSVFAGQSEMNRQNNQTHDPVMQGNKEMGSSIESKSSSNQNTEPTESEEQRAARPGGVGEGDPATSMFGSSSSKPPIGTSSGYEGADKEAEEMERRLQEERKSQ